MTKKVLCEISKSLYNAIKEEKKKLREKELKKVKSRKKVITMVVASQSLARKLR